MPVNISNINHSRPVQQTMQLIAWSLTLDARFRVILTISFTSQHINNFSLFTVHMQFLFFLCFYVVFLHILTTTRNCHSETGRRIDGCKNVTSVVFNVFFTYLIFRILHMLSHRFHIIPLSHFILCHFRTFALSYFITSLDIACG